MYKKIIIITIVIILSLSALLLPACHNGEEEVATLSAWMEGATFTWNAFEGADAYLVKCTFTDKNGYSIKVKETSYIAPYTTPGDYYFSVTALDKNGKRLAESETITYHLGTGEAADVITIGSADDLMAITESFTLSFGKTKIDSPIYYRMTADVDLTGKEFKPIGTSSKPFKSVFDGAGHTIKGLSFTTCTTGGDMGLFGYTQNAVIKNLNLEASLYFDKNTDVGKGELNCGLLIGHAVSTLVDNCEVKGNMDILSGRIKADSYDLYAGGIIGKAESGRISGVSFVGDLRGQYGKASVGGILGFANGKNPELVLVNARSIANVKAVGTAYNVTTNTSNAMARAGVLVGNLSYAARVASCLAIGTAEATYDNNSATSAANLTAGVFGRANADSLGITIPTHNLYYSASIPAVAGNTSLLGSYKNYILPLTDDQLKTKYAYSLEEGRYGLNFDEYWDMPDNDYPTLKRRVMEEQPTLTMSVVSEVKDHEFNYDFVVEDVMVPTYYKSSLGKTVYSLGYNLDNLLDSIGAGITSVYTTDEIKDGVSIKISAEGLEDRVVTTKTTSLHWYLQYGFYPNYESREEIFEGYNIIDATNSGNLLTYDYTTVDHITITFLPADGAKG